MMIVRKFFPIVFAALLLSTTLITACGGGGSGSDTNTDNTSTETDNSDSESDNSDSESDSSDSESDSSDSETVANLYLTMTGLTAGSDTLVLTWTAPEDNESYSYAEVSYTDGASASGTVTPDTDGTATISALTAETEYTVTVTSYNSSDEMIDEGDFTVETVEDGGDSLNYYFVYSAADLDAIRGSVDGYDDFSLSGNYIQMDDISLSDYSSWEPLGYHTSSTDYEYFTGMLDGNGYTISDLVISSTSRYTGLFGYVESGTLKNITVDGDIEMSGDYNAGILAGVTQGGSDSETVVENCKTSGTVTSSGENTGGLIGSCCYSIVTSSSSSATVEAGPSSGGLIGYLFESEATDCYATGDVDVTDTTAYDTMAGGLIADSVGSTISRCYATGDVSAADSTGSGSMIGGFIGRLYLSPASESFATGLVEVLDSTTTGNSYAGGFAGFLDNNGYDDLENCYSTGNVSCSSGYRAYAGGFAGYASGDVNEDATGTKHITTYRLCYSTGTASATADDTAYEGGFIGNKVTSSSSFQANFSACYFDKTTSGTENAYNGGSLSGISGEETSFFSSSSNYDSSWDFSTVWVIDNDTTLVNGGYPYLLNNQPPSE